MTNATEEVFKAMNASNILVAILTQLGKVDVSYDTFISANGSEKQLSVTYNDQTNCFEFKVREGEQDEYELVND